MSLTIKDLLNLDEDDLYEEYTMDKLKEINKYMDLVINNPEEYKNPRYSFNTLASVHIHLKELDNDYVLRYFPEAKIIDYANAAFEYNKNPKRLKNIGEVLSIPSRGIISYRSMMENMEENKKRRPKKYYSPESLAPRTDENRERIGSSNNLDFDYKLSDDEKSNYSSDSESDNYDTDDEFIKRDSEPETDEE